jgi:hypothetical protein
MEIKINGMSSFRNGGVLVSFHYRGDIQDLSIVIKVYPLLNPN